MVCRAAKSMLYWLPCQSLTHCHPGYHMDWWTWGMVLHYSGNVTSIPHIHYQMLPLQSVNFWMRIIQFFRFADGHDFGCPMDKLHEQHGENNSKIHIGCRSPTMSRYVCYLVMSIPSLHLFLISIRLSLIVLSASLRSSFSLSYPSTHPISMTMKMIGNLSMLPSSSCTPLQTLISSSNHHKPLHHACFYLSSW